MNQNQTVAFVGLGQMGRPMSGHLANAGYRVRTASDRRKTTVAAMAADSSKSRPSTNGSPVTVASAR